MKEWTGRLSSEGKPKEKTITEQMNAIIEEICDNYCKYTDQYLPKNPGDDVDMLEDMLYTEICANCPLMKW